ncbi:MAG: hypothetical protein ACO3ZW_05870 [Opitutales bacterium]|jgi:hypothetical protein
MPDLPAIIALALLPCQLMAVGLEVQGMTTRGIKISGTISMARHDILEIETSDGSCLGYPMDRIALLETPVDLAGTKLLESLEPVLTLLSKWGPDTLGRAAEAVMELPEKGDWKLIHLWSNRLIPLIPAMAGVLDLRLARAQALCGMGLKRQAKLELDELRPQLDPLAAPSAYYHMMAALARDAGKTREAQFWESLPRLKIPIDEGEELPQSSGTIQLQP